MQGLFREETQEVEQIPPASPAGKWSTLVLGFIGSAVIFFVGLKELAPIFVSSWGVGWIINAWVRVAVAIVVAIPAAALLSRIEGTIWGTYYVIVGYLLSLGLIVWIVLRLLHYL